MVWKSLLALSVFFLAVTSVSANGSIGTVLTDCTGSSSGLGTSGSVSLGSVQSGDVLAFCGYCPANSPIPVNLGTGYTNWVNNEGIYTCVASVSAETVTVHVSIPYNEPTGEPWAASVASFTGSTGVVYNFGSGSIDPPFPSVSISHTFPSGSAMIMAWGGDYGDAATSYALNPGDANQINYLLYYTDGKKTFFGWADGAGYTSETWTLVGTSDHPNEPNGGCGIIYLIPLGTVPG
jgi:hypothetical protein